MDRNRQMLRKPPAPWPEAAESLGLFAHQQWTVIELSGYIGKFDVCVTATEHPARRGASAREQIAYRLTFPSTLPLDLSIRNEVPLTRFIRLVGPVDIEVGDPYFDQKVYVKGSHRNLVRDFLTEVRRKAILNLVESRDVVILGSKSILVLDADPSTDADRIVETVRMKLLLADSLFGTSTARSLEALEVKPVSGHEAEQEARPVSEPVSKHADDQVSEREADREADLDSGGPLKEVLEVDWSESWLLGVEVLPTWMAQQGVRLEDERAADGVDESSVEESRTDE